MRFPKKKWLISLQNNDPKATESAFFGHEPSEKML